jgi:hypothetical protein
MRNRIGWMFVLAGILTSSSSGLLAQENWVYRYNGSGNGSDEAYSIAMDPDSNLYAAGYSYGTGTSSDFTVVSLTNSGTERWVYTYDGPANSFDAAYSVAVGLDGNIYATGYSVGVGTSRDIVIISLRPTGVERWVYRYDGPGSSWDEASSIITSPDGSVYAAGYSYGSGTLADFTVVSLGPGGNERWVYRYNGSGNDYDRAYSIVRGWGGNLYAAGYAIGSTTYSDLTVVSLTSGGSERWVYLYDGSGNYQDKAYSIAAGPDTNLYVAGYSSGTSSDLTVVGLTSSGAERWVYTYDGPAHSSDDAGTIILGPDGNLYAAGTSYGTGTRGDFIVVSLTDSGEQRWTRRHNGTADTSDAVKSIVMPADGNLYAAGMTHETGTFENFTVLSLTDLGAIRWVYTYNGPADTSDGASSILAGLDGNIYVAGMSIGVGSSADLTVVSLSSDVGVEEEERAAIKPPVLEMSVSPVPASSALRIEYLLPRATEVRLSIYDISGKLVRNLADGSEQGGSRVVPWDGKDSQGRKVPSGTYFVRLEACGSCISRKLVIM